MPILEKRGVCPLLKGTLVQKVATTDVNRKLNFNVFPLSFFSFYTSFKALFSYMINPGPQSQNQSPDINCKVSISPSISLHSVVCNFGGSSYFYLDESISSMPIKFHMQTSQYTQGILKTWLASSCPCGQHE